MEQKILDLIPESLHPKLIDEVKEILKKEQDKAKELASNKKATEKEIEELVKKLMD